MKTSVEVLEWPRLCAVLGRMSETALGRAQAERLRPPTTYQRVAQLHAEVAAALDLVRRDEAPRLQGAEDLRDLLARARRGGAGMEGTGLFAVLSTLRVASQARDRLLRLAPEALQQRARSLPDHGELCTRLAECVDADGTVPDRADPRLAALRRDLDGAQRRVRRMAQQLAGRREFAAVLREGPPVRRNGRFMLAVKGDARGLVPGVLHDQSGSGATVFIEPFDLVEPQNKLVAMHQDERRLVGRILLECTRQVLAEVGEIHETLRQLGSLDLLLARARYGEAVRGHLVPVLEQGPMVLHRVYHPLLLAQAGDDIEAAREQVVPFGLTLGAGFDVLVITGPNTGGKTVTLKAVGLVALMALCGVPAPVDPGSQVPYFDAVHADIGDEQDLQQSLSTFSGHLRRIAHLLRHTTRHSLVLLDELGSGTDPLEGEALGRALLQELRLRGTRVVATTHLSGLKDLGFEEARVENASLEFDVESLQPLYRLVIGLPGESNALRIAARHGIPSGVLEQALRDLQERRGLDAMAAAEVVERSRRRALQHLQQAEREHRAVAEERATLQAKMDDWKEWAGSLETQKQQEIDRVLRLASEEGLTHLERLGTLPAHLREPVGELRQYLASLTRRSSLAARREAFVRSRKRDDVVYLPRYRESCRVRKVDRARLTVTVLYRAVPLEVAFSEVACPEDFAWEGPTDGEPPGERGA